MKTATAEWVKKADDDYGTMLRDYRARNSPNYDGCCFHAQQCVEKYLKARLQNAGVAFPKTHDLVALVKLSAPPLEPLWLAFVAEFTTLRNAAVEVRYHGASATKESAKASINTAKKFRAQARARLGLR